MLRGLTRAGLGNGLEVEAFAKLAGAYRFEAIDVGGSEISTLFATYGVEGSKEFLAAQGVVVGSIGLPVEWRTDEETFRSGLRQLAADAEAAAQVGCTACCTYVLPSTDYNAAHFMALATSRLRACAQILGAYGLHLGLEFVGPHHLRTRWANPFIWDMSSTLDWIDAIGESNVGLLLDAYHWYTTSGTVSDIEKLTASQIVHVHINDAPELPVEQVLDNDRLYPGEGVIDLGGFLGALKKIGYQGAVAQEVLTPVAPTESPEALCKKSAELYDRLFPATGA
ncbi:MAG: sugar phosphate isomerase/epimerase [Firmicutes bacterium]|nr:sugar phosphate isomerase/epimerase [Bacillota bacterium]